MKGWGSFTATKKGDMGERIIIKMLKSLGYVLYIPEDEEVAHAIDLIRFNGKEGMEVAEVKVKRHREKYPDTGIDFENYLYYLKLQIKHNVRCYVYFVDTFKGQVYGNYLDILDEQREINLENGRQLFYPLHGDSNNGRRIRYFPLTAMEHIIDLTPEQCQEIDKHIIKI